MPPLPPQPGSSTEPTAHRVPLSAGQERLWILDQMVPEGTYNVTECFRLTGALDVPALRGAAQALVARHDALRTCVDDEAGVPQGRVMPPDAVSIEATSHVARGEQELENLLTAAALRPFDLWDGPLLRVTSIRLSGKRSQYVVLLVMHHMAVDGWSGAILRREFWELYDAFACGRTPRLPELTAAYGDYVAWQQAWLDSEEAEEQLSYWCERLTPAPETVSFRAEAGAAPEPRPTEVVEFTLPPAAVQAVRDAGPVYGTTAFVVVLAGFAAALYQVARTDEFVVGTPVTDRPTAALEGVIGSFDNTVLLRIAPEPSATVREFVEHVRTVALHAFVNKEIPFQRVVRALGPARGGGAAPPLCNVAFSVEEAIDERWDVHGAEVAPHPWVFLPPARFDLTLMAELAGDTVTGRMYLDPARVPRRVAERLAHTTADVLTRLSTRPDSPLRAKENADD
ncbi:condensation domain-containing protein [Streptomyces sp. NPDC018964]|uniref:condensation domain-containing protein n=1 Tax=Streptomyces sp. NPDC018964 TaxID=3365058 RepID=UPI003794AAE0